MRVFTLLTAALLFTACAHSAEKPQAPAEEAEASQETGPAQEAAAAAPDSPAGDRLAWFISTINEGGNIDEETARENFSENFLAQVPPAQLVTTFAQLGQGFAPMELRTVTEQSPHSLVAEGSSSQGPVRISIAVEEEEPHRFEGLLITPAQQ